MTTPRRRLVIGLITALVLSSVAYGSITLYRGVALRTAPPAETGSYAEHGPYYDITATYATSTPLGGSAGVAAGEVQRDFVLNRIAEFKKNGNFDHLSQEDIQMMGYDEGRRQTLTLSYLMATSPATISYVYTIEEYTGGAHGNTETRTFTFSREKGTLLDLGDLFVSGAPYLTTLSSMARERLPAIIGELTSPGMIDEGTSATEGNFSRFFLDESSLVIIFPPYAVAAYAAGTQTLALPRSELKALLRPAYQ